jgi:hypothetical protein
MFFAMGRLVLMAAGIVAVATALTAQPAAEAPEPTTEAVPPVTTDDGPRSTWLLGHARTGRRRWVTGAVVLATPESGESRIFVTTTDEKGKYRFESIPEGVYDVILMKHGLAPVTKDDVVLKFPFRQVLEVLMEPGAGEVADAFGAATTAPGAATSLEGLVRSRDGEALAEVRIRLIRADGTVDPRFAMSGQEGRFNLSDLEPGGWRMEILGAGFLPIRAPVTLAGQATVTAVLVAQPASYEPQPLDLMPPEMPIPPPEPEADASSETVADAAS